MRQWHVDPRILCDRHLLGEHVEHHMYIGAIKKGISLKGYLDRGQVAPHTLHTRHEDIVREMVSRGMRHNSPLPPMQLKVEGTINVENNLKDLLNRCSRCKNRFDNFGSMV